MRAGLLTLHHFHSFLYIGWFRFMHFQKSEHENAFFIVLMCIKPDCKPNSFMETLAKTRNYSTQTQSDEFRRLLKFKAFSRLTGFERPVDDDISICSR